MYEALCQLICLKTWTCHKIHSIFHHFDFINSPSSNKDYKSYIKIYICPCFEFMSKGWSWKNKNKHSHSTVCFCWKPIFEKILNEIIEKSNCLYSRASLIRTSLIRIIQLSGHLFGNKSLCLNRKWLTYPKIQLSGQSVWEQRCPDKWGSTIYK